MNYFKGKKYKKKNQQIKDKIIWKKKENLNEFYKLLNLKIWHQLYEKFIISLKKKYY